MSEHNHGGDISSGFGDSTVTGPVSDEKAEQMMHGDRHRPPAQDAAAPADAGDSTEGTTPRDPGPAEGATYSEQDVATNEQDLNG